MRQKYGHHYRQMLPLILEHLTFRSENRFQPLIEALAVLQQYLGTKGPYFPAEEAVPLDGVVLPSWRDTVLEEHEGQIRINRQYYELCVLQRLERAVKCKEVWVEGAYAFRNPSQDMPPDWQEESQRGPIIRRWGNPAPSRRSWTRCVSSSRRRWYTSTATCHRTPMCIWSNPPPTTSAGSSPWSA
jgi:hypothetical protein